MLLSYLPDLVIIISVPILENFCHSSNALRTTSMHVPLLHPSSNELEFELNAFVTGGTTTAAVVDAAAADVEGL